MQKTRKGFSLAELLIAIVILGIISSGLLITGSKAQEKARVSAAMTCLDDYESAFTTVCLNHPGVMKDRIQEQEAAEAASRTYTSKQALARLVTEMNAILEPSAQLYWDATYKCFRSYGEDPWGGFFILTEHPRKSGVDTGWNPKTGLGISSMRCAVWATGNNEFILKNKTLDKNAVGAAFCFKDGLVDATYNAVKSGDTPFDGYYLTLQ